MRYVILFRKYFIIFLSFFIIYSYLPAQKKEIASLSGIYLQAFSATQYTAFVQEWTGSVYKVDGRFPGYGFAVGYEYYPGKDLLVGFSAGINYMTSKVGSHIESEGASSALFNDIRHTLITMDIGLQYPFANYRIIIHGMFNIGMSISSYDYINTFNSNMMQAGFYFQNSKGSDRHKSEAFFRGGGSVGGRIFFWNELAFLIEYRTIWAKSIITSSSTSSSSSSSTEDYYTDALSIGVSCTIPW